MIISASRRTDIPCRYSEWFMNRIEAGYALIRNPMNHKQLQRITLAPDIVDCIVFWSKDPSPMLPKLERLDADGYKYYFQFTLTPYDRSIEPGLRTKSELIETFVGLSRLVGRDRIVWRYDPIIINNSFTVEWHKKAFASLCKNLGGCTDTVTISFLDMYPKLKAPGLRTPDETERAELSEYIAEAAARNGVRAVSCCEGGLDKYGILPASCIDRERIERICGCTLMLKADKNQRMGCGCAESIDLGIYNTCPNGCVYCYANHSPETVLRRFAEHSPTGELLFGSVAAGEEASVRSCKTNKAMQPDSR